MVTTRRQCKCERNNEYDGPSDTGKSAPLSRYWNQDTQQQWIHTTDNDGDTDTPTTKQALTAARNHKTTLNVVSYLGCQLAFRDAACKFDTEVIQRGPNRCEHVMNPVYQPTGISIAKMLGPYWKWTIVPLFYASTSHEDGMEQRFEEVTYISWIEN